MTLDHLKSQFPEEYKHLVGNNLQETLDNIKAQGFDILEDYQQFDEQGCYYGATYYYIFNGHQRLFVFGD